MSAPMPPPRPAIPHWTTGLRQWADGAREAALWVLKLALIPAALWLGTLALYGVAHAWRVGGREAPGWTVAALVVVVAWWALRRLPHEDD